MKLKTEGCCRAQEGVETGAWYREELPNDWESVAEIVREKQ